MRKYKFIFLIISCTLISISSLAQNKSKIYGWVNDYETREPVPNVNVTIIGTNIGTTTDSSGYFKLELNPGKSYNIEFSYIGYTKTIRKVSLKKDEEIEYNIDLKSHPIELSPVVKISKFGNIPSTFTFDKDELKKAGDNDLEKALIYLEPIILYPDWFLNRNSLKENLYNASYHNFTLYVNGKLVDSSTLDEISIDKIKFVKVWKAWRPKNTYGKVDIAPVDMPLVEGNYVLLIVTK